MTNPIPADAGHAVYTPLVLRTLYDPWVLGCSNRWLWRCPTGRLLEFFNRHVSANHLDVGVGTGYYLDRCRFPSAAPRVALLDANAECLSHTARRIVRYRPDVYRADILRPLDSSIPAFEGPAFESVSLFYLLHCLLGTLKSKAVVFDHLRPWLAPGAKLFGATLVQGSVPRSLLARRLMEAYNAKGVFCNRNDTVEDLTESLSARFPTSSVTVEGGVAMYVAVANAA